mmetsp:Transcript_29300/g.76767  ORF Transcript_29300/g.76767 Transcript_29300/m.76767 type:complete len:357 (+) Transcript_29300:356-1426(+)
MRPVQGGRGRRDRDARGAREEPAGDHRCAHRRGERGRRQPPDGDDRWRARPGAVGSRGAEQHRSERRRRPVVLGVGEPALHRPDPRRRRGRRRHQEGTRPARRHPGGGRPEGQGVHHLRGAAVAGHGRGRPARALQPLGQRGRGRREDGQPDGPLEGFRLRDLLVAPGGRGLPRQHGGARHRRKGRGREALRLGRRRAPAPEREGRPERAAGARGLRGAPSAAAAAAGLAGRGPGGPPEAAATGCAGRHGDRAVAGRARRLCARGVPGLRLLHQLQPPERQVRRADRQARRARDGGPAANWHAGGDQQEGPPRGPRRPPADLGAGAAPAGVRRAHASDEALQPGGEAVSRPGRSGG